MSTVKSGAPATMSTNTATTTSTSFFLSDCTAAEPSSSPAFLASMTFDSTMPMNGRKTMPVSLSTDQKAS